MRQHPLAEFLEVLERAGELERVTAAVDPELELAEITNRVSRAGGPALLFEQVRGARLPTVTNLFGSQRRICLALGIHSVDELVGRVTESLDPRRSAGWLDRLRRPTAAGPGSTEEPTQVKSAPCQQIVRLGSDVDLSELPVLKCWPEEERPAITWCQIFSYRADLPSCCLGSYRLEVIAKNKLAIHWLDHEPVAEVFRYFEQRGQQMPICIVLGGRPRDIFMAWLLKSAATDPRLLHAVRAGELHEVVQCKTIDMTAAADADVVLECRIDPASPPVDMGPSGGWHGQYLLPRQAHAIEVTAITERVNSVVPAVIPTGPLGEWAVLADVLSRITLPLLKLRIPELVDCHVPAAGGPNGFALVAIRKTYAGQVEKIAAALWGSDEFFLTKFIVVVDEQIDVRDHAGVMLAVGANVDPARDIFFHAARGNALDRAAHDVERTRNMAIDATSKLPGEHPRRRSKALVMPDEIEKLVQSRWPEYGWQTPFPGESRAAGK